MSRNVEIAFAAILVGGAFLSRRAAASEPSDDVLEEIQITARRLSENFDFDALFPPATRPLGIRNNNPMNVRETNITWQGELPHDNDGYEDFENAGDGIRAGARVLLNYKRLHGLDTVRGIITRWAPPADNNPTDSYVTFVANAIDVHPDEQIDVTNLDTLTRLAAAIIRFETGRSPYTTAFIRQHAARAF